MPDSRPAPRDVDAELYKRMPVHVKKLQAQARKELRQKARQDFMNKPQEQPKTFFTSNKRKQGNRPNHLEDATDIYTR